MRTGEHLTSLWDCPSTAMDHSKRLKVKIRWPRIVFTTEKSTMISNKFMHSDVRHQTTIHNGTRLSVLRPSMYCYQSNGHVPNCNDCKIVTEHAGHALTITLFLLNFTKKNTKIQKIIVLSSGRSANNKIHEGVLHSIWKSSEHYYFSCISRLIWLFFTCNM